MAEAEKTAQEEQKREHIDISFYKRVYGNGTRGTADSYRKFEGKDGREWASMTLPYGFPGMKAADGQQLEDGTLGGFKATVPAWTVRDYPDDPNYHHVSFPKTGPDGQPWTVDLTKTEGHRDEGGEYVVDSETTYTVEAAELKRAAEQYRDERRAYHQKSREQQKGQPKEQAAPEAEPKEQSAPKDKEPSIPDATDPNVSMVDLMSMAKECRAAAEKGAPSPAGRDGQSR